MTTSETILDPFIVIEEGLVQNDPELPVFDMDGLVNQDIDWVQNFYERLLTLIGDRYAGSRGDFSLKDLPPSLRYVLREAENAIIDYTQADAGLMTLARHDEQMLSELFENFGHKIYGERTAQALAARVLSTVGVSVPQDQTVVLTDLDPEASTGQISASQLQYAVGQYNLITGEDLDADQIEEALGWL